MMREAAGVRAKRRTDAGTLARAFGSKNIVPMCRIVWVAVTSVFQTRSQGS